MTIDIETKRPINSMRLCSVSEVSKKPGYEPFSSSVLRHLIFDSKDRVGAGGSVVAGNGLASAIIRIGRRVLIDLDRFDAWIEIQREGE